MILRTGYLPTVQQLVVPGHSRDARLRQMMMFQKHNHEKQHRQKRHHVQPRYFI